jgi:hypothetical protein
MQTPGYTADRSLPRALRAYPFRDGGPQALPQSDLVTAEYQMACFVDDWCPFYSKWLVYYVPCCKLHIDGRFVQFSYGSCPSYVLDEPPRRQRPRP